MQARRFQVSHRHYAGEESCFERYEAEYKKYLKLMWDEPVFSEKRREYEKKANDAKKQQKLCGEGGTTIFDAGAPPQKLWTTPYKKRKVDLSGLLGPEDTIVAVAKGMNPGIQFALEDRATIKGGLMALYAAGLSDYDPTPLKVTTLNLPKDDQALVKAAGGKLSKNLSKDLSAAADAVRSRVSKEGDGLKKAAWGLRGLYILGTLVGFQIVRGAAATVVNFIPVAGQIASAAIAVHGAISGTIAENVKSQFNLFIESGMEEYAQAVEKQAVSLSPSSGNAGRVGFHAGSGGGAGGALFKKGAASGGTAMSNIPAWGWAVGGAAVAGLALLLLTRRR